MEEAKDWSYAFYNSTAWKRCREAYKSKVGGLCERCLAEGIITPAEEIHHRVPLTPETINDPAVSLNFDNLEALCRKHHQLAHRDRNAKVKRYVVDRFGKVTPTE